MFHQKPSMWILAVKGEDGQSLLVREAGAVIKKGQQQRDHTPKPLSMINGQRRGGKGQSLPLNPKLLNDSLVLTWSEMEISN